MSVAFDTPSHRSFSRAPAISSDGDLDAARASIIAKPQKAFAIAFAVLAAALAGCASGLGANSSQGAGTDSLAYVEEGAVVGPAIGKSAGDPAARAYTIRLSSGELVSVAQAGDYVIPAGTPVLVEYGAHPRVIPQ